MSYKPEFVGPTFFLHEYLEWLMNDPSHLSIRVGIDALVRCDVCQKLVAPALESHRHEEGASDAHV